MALNRVGWQHNGSRGVGGVQLLLLLGTGWGGSAMAPVRWVVHALVLWQSSISGSFAG